MPTSPRKRTADGAPKSPVKSPKAAPASPKKSPKAAPASPKKSPKAAPASPKKSPKAAPSSPKSPAKKKQKVEKFVLHKELQAKLDAARKARNFNAKTWINKKVKMFNDYMSKCGLKACVVSLSGGVDSAVTLGLMREAQKAKNSPIKRVLAISQPIKSSQWAFDRAHEAAKDLGSEIVTVDQTEIHAKLSALVGKAVGVQGKAFADGQLRSYMRTPVGYYVAQLLSQEGTPCVVMGTGNMDEDGYLLYYCKAGDGVVDVQLIADLHKSEVFKVGKELGVPESILVAPPSADLWEDQTDEDELGFSYDFVELFTNPLGNTKHFDDLPAKEQAAFLKGLSKDALDQWNTASDKARAVHRRNKHKLNSPMNLNVL